MLVSALMNGKGDDLEQHISRNARTTLQKIREGKLTDSEKEKLKKTFTNPQLSAPPRNNKGGRQISLRSETDNIILLVKKEGEHWKVAEMTITPVRR